MRLAVQHERAHLTGNARRLRLQMTTLVATMPRVATAAVRAVDLTKQYGTREAMVRALDGVTIDIAAGRFTVVMGASGSGKSTLLQCIAGLDRPTSGRVVIGDADLGTLSDRDLTLLRRERIGFVFQSFNLVPTLTVDQNITLPLLLAGRRPDPEWTREIVAAVGLQDRLAHRPGELSGGQQQRVAIARALVMRPHIVVADEPTGNLDSRSGGQVLDLLGRAVRELGQTVVMVTHDAVAAARAHSVVFLADGRVVDQIDEPTPSRVLSRIAHLGD